MRAVKASLFLLDSALAITIYLCGDSTMADPITNGKGSPIDLARVGWGAPFRARLAEKVENLAVIGASVRSFTNDGVFDTIIHEIGAGGI